jgi:hypothetical protein
LAALARDVDALSLSLAHTLHATVGDSLGADFYVRSAEAGQFSYGPFRTYHPDQRHLGDLILTITFVGDCIIHVERVEQQRSRTNAWSTVQTPGCCYAIWGPSLIPVEHQVLQHLSPARFSLTLRYVARSDLTPTPEQLLAHSSLSRNLQLLNDRRQRRRRLLGTDEPHALLQLVADSRTASTLEWEPSTPSSEGWRTPVRDGSPLPPSRHATDLLVIGDE